MNKIIILCIFILISAMTVSLYGKLPHVDAKTKDGVSYIREAEKGSVEELEVHLKYKREEEVSKAVREGKMDVFSLFDDFAFFGDSRVMGYNVYGFLPPERIYANTGDTIYSVDRWLEILNAQKPSTIYFSYGINDTLSDIGNREGGYDRIFETQIKKVEQVCPQAKIYVLSIIPPNKEAVKDRPGLARYITYNEQLKFMCEKNHWTYVNCDTIIPHAGYDVYQEDGIHFVKDFYKLWAAKIIESQ